MAAMEWRALAASTWTFKEYPLLKALEVIHLSGVAEVELWAEGAHLDPRGDVPDLEAVGAALDRLGLWPSGMHAPFKGLDLSGTEDARRQSNVDVLKRALDVAAALDCVQVVIHVDGAGEDPAGANESDRRRRLEQAAGALEQLCDYALELGITLLVENQPDPTGARIGSRTEELVRLIELVDMPNLGLCFDVAHAIVSAGDWSDEWEAAAAHVASIHVSDTYGRDDDHLALGEGSVDWARFARTLGELGPELDIVLEVAGGEEALRRSLAELDRVAADL